MSPGPAPKPLLSGGRWPPPPFEYDRCWGKGLVAELAFCPPKHAQSGRAQGRPSANWVHCQGEQLSQLLI